MRGLRSAGSLVSFGLLSELVSECTLCIQPEGRDAYDEERVEQERDALHGTTVTQSS